MISDESSLTNKIVIDRHSIPPSTLHIHFDT